MAERAAIGRRQPGRATYDEDFYSWTLEQAALLRAGKVRDADLANIAEELETLGRSEAAALRSSLRLILMHLLTFRFQPDRASRSWLVTIVRERINITENLDENPGLKPRLEALATAAYRDARKLAAAETGLPIGSFPEQSPFTTDDIRNGDVDAARDLAPG